jgi:hypothetical protein
MTTEGALQRGGESSAYAVANDDDDDDDDPRDRTSPPHLRIGRIEPFSRGLIRELDSMEQVFRLPGFP